VQVVVLATSSWGKSMAAACLVLLLELWNEVLGVHATMSLAGSQAPGRQRTASQRMEESYAATRETKLEGGSPQTPKNRRGAAPKHRGGKTPHGGK